LFCRARLEEYDALKSEFLRGKGLPESTKVVPVQFRAEWKEKLERHRGYRDNRWRNEAPVVRQHKAQVLRWMSFWPISMIWGLINDFVKRVCKTIYTKLSKFLQRVSDNIFSGVQDDLDVPTTPEDSE